jgi:hypothetical protein
VISTAVARLAARRVMQSGFVALAAVCGGCYEYGPMPMMRQSDGRREVVELLLNERGRADLVNEVGPDAMSVEGALVARADSSVTVSIQSVMSISRSVTKWSGERLVVRTSQLRDIRIKRLSRSKTFTAVGAAIGGAFVFIISRTLGGRGNTNEGGVEPPNPS